LFKLFDGCNFPYLVDLNIEYFKINRLTKEFINRLPMHKKLNMTNCEIEVIESDSFSNMQQLTLLNLSSNRIGFIEENTFSKT
jgi:Leucine-rich repeat (LRR) protein